MMHHEPPFLTAYWTDLLLLNFPVPSDAVAQLAPPGTEPDLFDGQAYISIVGFQFRDTRVCGRAWPRHTHFPEINLRYYVRRCVGDEVRRGVVFVQEIVPRHLIALVANRLFHEHYVCRPMRSERRTSNDVLNQGDQIAYGWQSRGNAGQRWNALAARVAGPLARPPANSFDEFIVEHYWGYTQGRDGVTREYRVAHEPWRVAPADDVNWDCDIAANYHTPLAKYLATPPATAVIAEGAAVEVFPGQKL
jgi:uncharacterized protein YqjF (DUF2071 family)